MSLCIDQSVFDSGHVFACVNELSCVLPVCERSKVILKAVQANPSTSRCLLAPITLAGAVSAWPQRELVLDVVYQLVDCFAHTISFYSFAF